MPAPKKFGLRLRSAEALMRTLFGLLFALSWTLQSAAARASPRTDQNEQCLACHGQQGMKSESGRSIYVNPAKHAASVHGSLGCTTCHASVKEYPHPQPMPRVKCATCHVEPATQVPQSLHGALGAQACASCHGTAHEAQRAA